MRHNPRIDRRRRNEGTANGLFEQAPVVFSNHRHARRVDRIMAAHAIMPRAVVIVHRITGNARIEPEALARDSS